MLLFAGIAAAFTPVSVTLPPGEAPPSLTATWAVEGCNVRVRLENAGETDREVDWAHSTWTPEGAEPVGLLPSEGATDVVGKDLHPLVVPAGGSATALLFRADRLPTLTDGCLFDLPSSGVFRIALGDTELAQPASFAPDTARLAYHADSVAVVETFAGPPPSCGERRATLRRRRRGVMIRLAGMALSGLTTATAGALLVRQSEGSIHPFLPSDLTPGAVGEVATLLGVEATVGVIPFGVYYGRLGAELRDLGADCQ